MKIKQISKFNIFLIGLLILSIGIAATFAASTPTPSSPLISSTYVDNETYNSPYFLLYKPATNSTVVAGFDTTSKKFMPKIEIPNFKGSTISLSISSIDIIGKDTSTNKMLMKYYSEADYSLLASTEMPQMLNKIIQFSLAENSYIYKDILSGKKGLLTLNPSTNAVETSSIFLGDNTIIETLSFNEQYPHLAISNSSLFEMQYLLDGKSVTNKGRIREFPSGITCNSLEKINKNNYCFANKNGIVNIFELSRLSTPLSVQSYTGIKGYVVLDSSSPAVYSVRTLTNNPGIVGEEFDVNGNIIQPLDSPKSGLTIIARTRKLLTSQYNESGKYFTEQSESIIGVDTNNNYYFNTQNGYAPAWKPLPRPPFAITNLFITPQGQHIISVYNPSTHENTFFGIIPGSTPNTFRYVNKGVITGTKITGISTAFINGNPPVVIMNNNLYTLELVNNTYQLKLKMSLKYSSSNDVFSSCKSMDVIRTTYFCLSKISSTQDAIYRISNTGIVKKISTVSSKDFILRSIFLF